MKILVFEDSGKISFYLKEFLISERHSVFSAYNIYNAVNYWSNNKNEINCIITDLNISPEGLKPNEISDTRDGLFTGWVWLENYVFKESEEMRLRTIIFSEYIAELQEKIPARYLKGIYLIFKRSSNSTSELQKSINQISKLEIKRS